MTLAPPPRDSTEKYRTPSCYELDRMLLVKELLARRCQSAVTREELAWYKGLSAHERSIIVPGRDMPRPGSGT